MRIYLRGDISLGDTSLPPIPPPLSHSCIRAEKRKDERRGDGEVKKVSSLIVGIMKTDHQLASRTNYGVKKSSRALKRPGQTPAPGMDARRSY